MNGKDIITKNGEMHMPDISHKSASPLAITYSNIYRR